MKKIDLSRFDGIIEKVSKFEFLLVEVVILLVVFAVVQKAPDLEAYETRNLSSLSVSWNRPTGYASFIDSGRKQANCTGSTSCSTASWTYYPGSPIIYTVKLNNREGAIVKDNGSAKADSSGRAKASWNWNYSVVVWPNNFTDCLKAGADCKTANVSNNNSSNTQTFGELKPNTDYRVIVCSPNCGTASGGGNKVVDRIQRTGIPASLVNPPTMQCNSATAKISVNFNWSAPAGASYDQVWLDFSNNEFFAPGYTQSQVFMPTTTTYSRADFAPSTQYYWRVNARIAGTQNAWVTSATAPFTTPPCNPPAPVVTCVMADVNRDGRVNSSDYQVIARQKTLPYDPKYDIDGNGKIEDADILWAATKAGTCSPRPYAISLSQTASCTTLGSGNNVRVNFSWSPATENHTEQFLDFDVYPHNDTGWPAVKASVAAVGQGSKQLESFAQGVTYYWRINTKVNGVWYGSAVKSFTTPKCYFVPEPADLQVVLNVTQKRADGTLCTDNPYGVVFRWRGIGEGWFLDVSPFQDFPAKATHSRDVSDRLFLITTGSGELGFSPPITFEPDKTYWWRMYSKATGKWYHAAIPAFQAVYCNPPLINEFPEGWPTSSGVISQGPGSGGTHSDLEAIDITGPLGTPIKATLSGVVSEICVDGGTCNYGGLGNALIVTNPNHGHKVIYAHLNTFLAANGQTIKKGDIIGGMGETGYAFGVHLHYEFRGLNMGTPYIPVNVGGCNDEKSCAVSW